MNIFKNSQLDFNVPIYGKKILDLVWDNFVDTIRMPMLQIVEEIVSKSMILFTLALYVNHFDCCKQEK